MNFSEMFDKFCKERNIKKNTIRGYITPLDDYCRFNELPLENLIDEAVEEENNRIPLKDRKLKQRLLDYRSYLLSSNKTPNTQKTYLCKVRSFYKHFEVQIPKLPSVKYRKDYVTNFDDLPTREHILKAYNISDLDMKALILFMSSSGTGKAETLSLTVQDFISACRDYTSETELPKILDSLEKKRNVVPTFYIKRVKTEKYYYTFCSPEAVSAIVTYLKSRKDLRESDRLFEISDTSLYTSFQEINDKMKWGFKGKYRFFRSHTLRKFHASNLNIDIQYIDELQGRGKTKVHEAYIKTNPVHLKEIYTKAMHNILIFKEEEKPVEKQEFNITINIFLSGKEYNII